jgi:NAD(P)-dependent dehydrogenase (short-subunit alcohol dehydrogenase family)
MDENTLNRRTLLGGMAAAGAAGAIGALASRDAAAQAAAAATGQAPAAGASQAPTITTMKDKVVYITGGSSGIGLGIARAMHEAGAKVVIGNLDEKQFPEALKNFPQSDPRIRTVVHNVMDKEGWQRTANLIEKMYGPVNILVNNAGVGLQQSASAGTLNDWEWGMGVNFWGPVYGVNAFVPRTLKSGQGCQIVTTTSTSGIVPNNGAGIYSVSKIAAVGLMEELRGELRNTNIGTTCFVPGQTTSNIGESESHRPDDLKNEAAAPARPAAAAGGAARPAAAAARPAPAAPPSPYWARPQDPVVVGRVVIDGILHNDLFVVLQPEWRAGVEARANALIESMVPLTPMPESLKGRDYTRTPIYAQEIAHRRATLNRKVNGI